MIAWRCSFKTKLESDKRASLSKAGYTNSATNPLDTAVSCESSTWSEPVLEVSDIWCHFMTRVMGSHFFTRDSRRSAASQPRISRGLRVECDRSMLALVLQ
jgi:hypothetical protein